MKQTFKQNGNAITFVPVPLKTGETQQKYTFIVEGDEELTQKLLALATRRKVYARSFPYMAEELFKLIDNGKFEEVITGPEIQKLTEGFQKRFSQNPRFEFSDLSKKGKPLFEARLVNTCLPNVGEQQAETRKQAAAKILKNLSALHLIAA